MWCAAPRSPPSSRRSAPTPALVDGPDLARRSVRHRRRPDLLGIEAIGGATTRLLADCLATAALVHYGSMCGEDPKVTRSNFIYRGVRAHRLHPRPLARHALAEQIRALYADLGEQLIAGKLSAPVDTIYPIENIKDALAHAHQGERKGKILVAQRGDLNTEDKR